MAIGKHIQQILTPDQVIDLLKGGNERFVNDDLRNIKTSHLLQLTKSGQNPIAAILACMDSRVPVERVFDKTIGELFAFRTPGNVVNKDIIGGMEYAASVAGTKLFVVMGHSSCGAVNAAVDKIELGNLTHSLNKIQTVMKDFEMGEMDRLTYVNQVIDKNVENSISSIRSMSKIMRDMEKNGDIKIVGANYDIETGKVRFFE
jgi:carbonic anhydrase